MLKVTADERGWLEGSVRTGKSAAWKIRHANAFLKIDRGEQGPAWEDARIAEAFGMSTRSLENWRKQAVEEGPREVLARYYPTRPQCRKLGGQAQAQWVKLACSQAPGERTGWTLNLLANKLVELEVVASISRETMRRTLKKTTSSRG